MGSFAKILAYFFCASINIMVVTSKLETTNQYLDSMSPHSITLRCTPDKDPSMCQAMANKNYILLSVRKDEATVIASLQRGNIVYKNPIIPGVEATGKIGTAPDEETYLSVTLTDVVTEDSGEYSCMFNYIDPLGLIHQESSSAHINVTAPRVQDVIRSMLSRLTLAEAMVAQYKKETSKNSLQLATHDRRISNIKQDYPTIAFSYAYDDDKREPLVVGEALKFPEAIMNEGNHYNPSTGIFVCPRDGLYVFHLIVTTKTENEVFINLDVNKETMATVFADNEDDKVQSTVSSLLKLKAGDNVRPTVAGFSDDDPLEASRHSLFTGYLIKPL